MAIDKDQVSRVLDLIRPALQADGGDVQLVDVDVVACAAGLKKGAEMALHCWETRGCDEEMASRCPHNIPGERCPGDCKFAVCDRPTHETAWGLDMLENPDVDREVVVKEFCLTCKFFIAHGPKVGAPESIKAREIVDARPYAVKRG